MTARIAGYVTRAQWGARPAKATTPLNGRRMEGEVVHHGAGPTPASHAGCASTWRGYQAMHLDGTRGPQNDIAYNHGVCPHGYVFEGRGFANQGGANGTAPANRANFSVCVIGTGDEAYSDAVTDALEWVIHEARTKHNAGDRVRAHRDFFATSCPGTRLASWVRLMDRATITPGTGGPMSDPTRPRLGDRSDLVRVIQQRLIAHGYPLPDHGADGSFGAETDTAVRNFQAAHGLDIDGIVGPVTLALLNADPAPKPAPVPDYRAQPGFPVWSYRREGEDRDASQMLADIAGAVARIEAALAAKEQP